MHPRYAVLAAALACAGAASALPMTQDAYKAQQMRIESEYDLARQRCKAREGNARDVCQEQVRGDRDIAQAALAFQYQPTADNDEKLRLAKAEAAYAVSMQKCKPLEGNGRQACRQDAKMSLADAKEEARLQKEVVAMELRSQQTVRERTEREEKVAQAEYNAARQRCDMLPGEGRANCLLDLKNRFPER